MRNSVKVTVDAYDGEMKYYADLEDPIIQVWSRVYPDLFTDMSEAPAELRRTSATRRTSSRCRRRSTPRIT